MNKDAYRDNLQTGSMLEAMDTSNKNLQNIGVELLPLHTGGTVHAKRMGGIFRKAKTIIVMSWSLFFLAPYIYWDGRQALLFDIADRKFHIFNLTLLTQDIWVLAMLLLFASLALAAVTAIAGRAWCGYACFQTVWQDVFTWVEEKIEGSPNKRMKLDKEPWSVAKIKLKIPKWIIWLFIGFMTGFTFVAYFTPVIDLWYRLFLFEWTTTETTIILVLGGLTTLFAGVLREQTCMGFCPYARIQGAMLDTETLVPTYDLERGEPRGRIKRVQKDEQVPDLGDCIDCNLCVAVCPTGVDIRKGQQFGCITCGLCIDACDSVMVKIKKPKGLIRYASLDEFAGKKTVAFLKRPRVIVYTSIMTMAAGIIVWGITQMAPIDLKVMQERAPLHVIMSNGDIRNKFYVRVINKTDVMMLVEASVTGHEKLTFRVNRLMRIPPGETGNATVFVRMPRQILTETLFPINISVQDLNNENNFAASNNNFIAPKRR